jgi:hypothetical protein
VGIGTGVGLRAFLFLWHFSFFSKAIILFHFNLFKDGVSALFPFALNLFESQLHIAA